ncbi:fimbrial biogenesis chaperone [Pantoea latae]|uniref:Molecular chaperone n=1 Tax=Pantoea latae TaxID=1964541 RepID=A0A1V9DHQ6_9GAMM|nr:molecular chaperone [Pantoea latae]OQP33390.1 molecular chaperone [Pantoea latae]
MKQIICHLIAALLSACLFSSSALAGITITGTRIIYPAAEKEVTVRLNNRADRPALVQAWIDDGDAHQALDKIDVPFVLLPPVSRVEAHKGQTLRLIYTGHNQAATKESVFWLNVLDIPPTDKKLAGKNQLQMALRSRIKIFFRPGSLSEEGAKQAAAGLIWRKGSKSDRLTASNPSPYFVNVSRVTVDSLSGRQLTTQRGEMLAPGATQEFTLHGGALTQIKPDIHYQYLDDYGAARSVDSQLTQ